MNPQAEALSHQIRSQMSEEQIMNLQRKQQLEMFLTTNSVMIQKKVELLMNEYQEKNPAPHSQDYTVQASYQADLQMYQKEMLNKMIAQIL